MSTRRRWSGVSISFGSALGLTFIALKIAGEVDWPWWLVLAPFWAGAAFVVGLFAAAFALVALAVIVDRGR